ncbi:MAG: hypothetical protein R3C61_28330 [Bacteroidia bacterium]
MVIITAAAHTNGLERYGITARQFRHGSGWAVDHPLPSPKSTQS